jgi:hypothetical protein
LTATPAQGYSFKGWSDGCFGTALVCALAPDADTTVHATFVSAGELELTVGGPGVVSMASAGLACGDTEDYCEANFPVLDQVQLTPTPAPGAQFAGWGGPCAQYGTGPCDVQVGLSTGVTATFENAGTTSEGVAASGDQASLTVTHEQTPIASAPDVLSSCVDLSPCTGEVTPGTFLTLTVGGGFVISGAPILANYAWSGACVGNWPVCSLVVDSPASVTVSEASGFTSTPGYKRAPNGDQAFQTTVSGAGIVLANGFRLYCSEALTLNQCDWNLPSGRLVTLVAKPSKRAHLVGWKGDCSGSRPTCKLRIGPSEGASAAFAR